MTLYENLCNGHGYRQESAQPDVYEYPELFPVDSSRIVGDTMTHGSCLIEAGVGAGKSHLIGDIGRHARYAFELDTLTFMAHINGGSRSGVNNALRVLDGFSEQTGDQGLIIVDNVDYYGYSGSALKRRYSAAQAHLAVASFLGELMEDEQAPYVCATAHNEVWRQNKWRYGDKLRDDDAVTPAAHELLDRFGTTYQFDGVLDRTIAERLLAPKFGEESPRIAGALPLTKSLCFRYVDKLNPQGVAELGLDSELTRIDRGTEARILGNRASRLMGTAAEI